MLNPMLDKNGSMCLGGKERHLPPVVTTACPEGRWAKTSFELRWTIKICDYQKTGKDFYPLLEDFPLSVGPQRIPKTSTVSTT